MQARVERVEIGLFQPIVVRGMFARTMRLEDRMRDLHVPGVSIAVINNGVIEWTRAYGLAEARTHDRVTDTTLFRAASISKPVTAVMAMRLSASRKIDAQ